MSQLHWVWDLFGMNDKRDSFVQHGLWGEKIHKYLIDGKDLVHYFPFSKGVRELSCLE